MAQSALILATGTADKDGQGNNLQPGAAEKIRIIQTAPDSASIAKAAGKFISRTVCVRPWIFRYVQMIEVQRLLEFSRSA